ncbi:MAG: large-conductance mechanosensitive channel protein MscL [Clostridiales bacterium]|jgi:large conductance mechanosensitive channel|nr:large-conductance mechanosensitive channel protein MscL [Clostridiales bacterium]
MKKFWSEFKSFAMRGNVVDLAVGVVIGTAFGKIVSSLVADILMPILSLITGRVNIASLSAVIPASINGGKPIVLSYGTFLQSIIDFLAIAFAIFLMIKVINRFQKKEEKPAAPGREELLLTEIRDLLKEQNEKSAE